MASEFEDIVNQLKTLYGADPPAWGAFRLSEREHGAMRRVLFFPISFVTRTPIESGPRIDADGKFYNALYRETWTVECQIWGNDWVDAEAVRRRILKATKQLFRKSSRPMGGDWVSQGAAEARHAYGGAEQITMRFEWDLDVFESDTPLESIELEQVETTTSLGESEETFSQPES